MTIGYIIDSCEGIAPFCCHGLYALGTSDTQGKVGKVHTLLTQGPRTRLYLVTLRKGANRNVPTAGLSSAVVARVNDIH